MEYKLDATPHGCSVTTGLLAPPTRGKSLSWDPYSRQAIHLFRTPQLVRLEDRGEEQDRSTYRLEHKASFTLETGEIDFQFTVTAAN